MIRFDTFKMGKFSREGLGTGLNLSKDEIQGSFHMSTLSPLPTKKQAPLLAHKRIILDYTLPYP
jgi:hypothetical protein